MLVQSSNAEITYPLSNFEYDCVSFRTEPRCYITHTPDIAYVCHHCGKAMSHVAGPFTLPKGKIGIFFENLEYADLNLESFISGNMGIHCEYCLHWHRSFFWIILWCIVFLVLIGSITIALHISITISRVPASTLSLITQVLR